MAAEWTFNVSYEPFLVLVAVDPENRTHDMILEAKEFGVNLVAADQVAAMGFAGHYSKSDTDKLTSDLFETYPGKRIRAPMIRGSLLNAECRLLQAFPMGDHTAFLGEVLDFSSEPDKAPVVLHHGSHRLGDRIVRDEGVVLAVTPGRAPAGETVSVAGELTAANRGGKAVDVSLLGPSDGVLATARALTDAHGFFRTSLLLPGSIGTGALRVVARAPTSTGTARVDVGEKRTE